jgi:tetratricopeptide (TPR) repeat protein
MVPWPSWSGKIFALPPLGLDDDRYAFKHALLRDAAYAQLAPSDRRRTHAAVAEWLTERLHVETNKVDHTIEAAIAQHWDLAGNRQAAAVAYRVAGERALSLFAHGEAARALQRARELSDNDDPDTLERLADALEVAQTVQAAREVYQRARDLTPGQNATQRARLCRKLGECAMRGGRARDAIDDYEEGLRILEQYSADPSLSSNGSTKYEYLIEKAALLGSMGWLIGYMMDDNARGLPSVKKPSAPSAPPPISRLASISLGSQLHACGTVAGAASCNQRNLEIGRSLATSPHDRPTSIWCGAPVWDKSTRRWRTRQALV